MPEVQRVATQSRKAVYAGVEYIARVVPEKGQARKGGGVVARVFVLYIANIVDVRLFVVRVFYERVQSRLRRNAEQIQNF